MILEQFLQVDIHQKMAKHYREKGYILDIPSYSVKGNHNTTHFYTAIVNINDLPQNSRFTVTRICDDCGKIDIVHYNKHQFEKCHTCSIQRPINYMKCQDCGKDLGHWNKSVTRCRDCNGKLYRGENHPSWKPDLDPKKRINDLNRSTKAYYDWVDLIKEKCNYTCQICGTTEKIQAHHLYDRRHHPDKIYDIDNGIALCHSCHMKYHASPNHRYGKETTPESFKKYMEELKNEHS